MDRLDAMRVFAAVAERGSFVQAARLLRLSPAAATRAVAALEDRIGATLLSRTTRAVRLTERGAQYLASCKQILADVEEAERRAAGEDATPRGSLTVSAPILFGRLHVLPVVVRMLRAHPDLSIRLTLSDRLIQMVEEGVDVTVRIGELADSALAALKVGSVRRVTVASPAYLAARGIPETPAALARHDVIAFEGAGGGDEWRFGRTDRIVVRVQPRLIVTTGDAALAAAEDALGITRVLSYQAHDAVAAGRLRLILEDVAPPPVPVSIVHPARRQEAANVRAFVAAARQYLATLPVLARLGA
jgi:DNA-binding transcriptional LysR family regulator